MSKQSKKERERGERYTILSLGCPKNTVDAHGMAMLLERAGYRSVDDPRRAGLVIVNTCGFIEPARAESLQALQELVADKRPGQLILATGCWAQRDPQAILQAIPGVDGLLGARRWMDVVDVARRLARPGRQGAIVHQPDAATVGQDVPEVPRAAAQGPSGYLKIADGCSRVCAFCAIPLIKGPAVSRPVEWVLADAAFLAGQGVREIVLIAQDTTTYGRDLGLENGLAGLLELLAARLPQVDWLRVMYMFPGAITPRLIDVMAAVPQILPYVDIPLQHAHPAVLRRMRRPADTDEVRRTVDTLRQRLPQVALRTAFIVGFPGETEEEFAALVDFVQEMAFDRVGTFVYSHEAGTQAGGMVDDVPAAVKQERYERLMTVQQPISLARNQALVDQVLDVLVEGQGEGLAVGRSYRDAPEIDGLVLIEEDDPDAVLPGTLLPVRITAAMEYDLIGHLAAR